MVITGMETYNQHDGSTGKVPGYDLKVTGKDELTLVVPIVDYGEYNETLGIKYREIKYFKIGEEWQEWDGIQVKEVPKE